MGSPSGGERRHGFTWRRSELGILSKESPLSSDPWCLADGMPEREETHIGHLSCEDLAWTVSYTEFYLILKKVSRSSIYKGGSEAHGREVTCPPSPSQGEAEPRSELQARCLHTWGSGAHTNRSGDRVGTLKWGRLCSSGWDWDPLLGKGPATWAPAQRSLSLVLISWSPWS